MKPEELEDTHRWLLELKAEDFRNDEADQRYEKLKAELALRLAALELWANERYGD